MTESTLHPVLDRQPFVRGLQPEQVRKLASLAKAVHFDRDQVIFREGDERYDFYLILSGLVALEIAPSASRARTPSTPRTYAWLSASAPSA